jgi:UDP-2-acetamido-3-amino-2,3-dideoxy-glucuronate N-acetyltransferase
VSVFIHDRGLCESDTVGDGTRIWAFAHVMRGAAVGRDCNVGEGAFVESGVVLGDRVTVKNHVLLWDGVTVGDDVFLGPNAVFTNVLLPRAWKREPEHFSATHVGEGATIGANATIVTGVSVGRFAMVGAGSVVIRDVPDYALVVGNPARQIGWVDREGERAEGPGE